MHQRKFEHVGRLAETVTSSNELGAADGEQVLRGQPRNVEPCPITIAVTNRDVDIFAREVDMVHSRRDSEVNPRVSLDKPRKPMHKPFCGKIGRGADRKDARGLSLHQALGSDGETIKRVPHDREILATRFRYDQALAFAIEQLDAEFGPPAP